MSFNPPPLPPQYGSLQVWWEDVRQSLKAELGSLEAAVAAQAAAEAAEAAAAAAAAAAVEYMPDLSDITITADYTGAVDPAAQVPKTVPCTRFNATTDVTSLSTWSATVTGGVTASINATTGVLTITGATTGGVIEVSSVRTVGGTAKTLSQSFNVDVSKAPAPVTGATSGGSSSGSGGTTSTDSSFNTIANATHAAVSNELTVTVGAGGQVKLSAPLGVTTDEFGSTGIFPVYGIWRHWNGAAYVDVGTEVVSSPSCSLTSRGTIINGSLVVSPTITGLTPAATEKYQLYARNSSGTRAMYLYGTVSAVGS